MVAGWNTSRLVPSSARWRRRRALAVSRETDGSPRTVAKVFNDGGFYGLAWTSDSTALISRDKDQGGYPLVRISIADGSKSFLTREPEVHDYQPVLSPDRKRLLFFRYNISRPQLCHMELEVSSSKPVCHEVRTGLGSATWTLDSRAILLASGDGLWLMKSGGGPSEPMTKLFDGVFSNQHRCSRPPVRFQSDHHRRQHLAIRYSQPTCFPTDQLE